MRPSDALCFDWNRHPRFSSLNTADSRRFPEGEAGSTTASGTSCCTAGVHISTCATEFEESNTSFSTRYRYVLSDAITWSRSALNHKLVIRLKQEYPHFYPEMVNVLEESASTQTSCMTLYTKFDKLELDRVVGQERSEHMLLSNKSTFLFS